MGQKRAENPHRLNNVTAGADVRTCLLPGRKDGAG